MRQWGRFSKGSVGQEEEHGLNNMSRAAPHVNKTKTSHIKPTFPSTKSRYPMMRYLSPKWPWTWLWAYLRAEGTTASSPLLTMDAHEQPCSFHARRLSLDHRLHSSITNIYTLGLAFRNTWSPTETHASCHTSAGCWQKNWASYGTYLWHIIPRPMD